MRRIVLPGEAVGKKVAAAGVFTEGEDSYASVYGMMDEREGIVRIVPLRGKYYPVRDDMVIGVVSDVKFGGCTVDINSPYSAFMPAEEEEFNYRDVVLAKIERVEETRNAVLGGARLLRGGELIEVSPVKVPRVIGKKGSMLAMITDATKCDVIVGRNGRICLKGGNLLLAQAALLKIEDEAHTTGLTDRIKRFLEAEAGQQATAGVTPQGP